MAGWSQTLVVQNEAVEQVVDVAGDRDGDALVAKAG